MRYRQEGRASRLVLVIFILILQLVGGSLLAGAREGDPDSKFTPAVPPTETLSIKDAYTVDHITLYYYDDPVQLMEVITGKQGAQVQTRAALSPLLYDVDRMAADVDIRAGNVNSRQTLLLQMQSKLEAALSTSKQANQSLAEASAKWVRSSAAQARTNEELKLAETKLAADPTSSTLKAAVERAQREATTNNITVAEDALTKGEATRAADSANASLQALSDTIGLNQASVKEQQNQLRVDRDALFEARSKLAAESRKEVLHFGQIRDEGPVYKSSLNVTAGTVTSEVQLAALPDSRAIVLMGPPDHVAVLAEWIEKFDRPQPQAMLTLWTLQMSSQATDSGAEDTEKALAEIESHLRATRQKIDGALALSRESLLQEVSVIGTHEGRVEAFYDPEFLKLMGHRQGEHVDFRRFFPDPGRASSIAEVITVGILSKPTIYKRVFTESQGMLSKPSVILGAKSTSGSTARLIGMRLEFALALRNWVLRRQIHRVRDFIVVYESKVSAEEARLAEGIAKRDPDALQKQSELREKVRKQLRDLQPALQFVSYHLEDGELTRAVKSIDAALDIPGFATGLFLKDLSKVRGHLAPGLDRKSPEGLLVGQEATVNEFLKKLVFSTEDAVQGDIIDPMYRDLAKQLRKQDGLSVGILEKTSVLASNRLIARVDPRATASIPLGQEQDILGALLQLGQIVGDVQTGNILTALSAQKDRDERKPRKAEEIYGLTTGSRFQVRPILDPTGQALRFRLDYVSDNVVRDPDSASNPNLNRIERHTVNTEVQLSNYEIREISRFHMNAKLGLPEKRFGGIPILNEIPGIQEIPLIGWFSRQWGEAPEVQSSLVFGQTNIYPTIDFILRRLTEGY